MSQEKKREIQQQYSVLKAATKKLFKKEKKKSFTAVKDQNLPRS